MGSLEITGVHTSLKLVLNLIQMTRTIMLEKRFYITILLIIGVNLSQSQDLECSNPSCGIALSVSEQCFLNTVCDNCEALTNDNEWRISCRKDCFQTQWFHFCLAATLTDKETAIKANDILVGINGGNIVGTDFQS